MSNRQFGVKILEKHQHLTMNGLLFGIFIALLGSQQGYLAKEISREFLDWDIETNPDTKSPDLYDSDYYGDYNGDHNGEFIP